MTATSTLRGRIEGVQTIPPVDPSADYEPLTVISVVDDRNRLKIAYGGPALLSSLLDLWPMGLEGHRVQIQLHGHLVDSIESMEAT